MEGLRPLDQPEDVLAGGQIERIGKPDAHLAVTAGAELLAGDGTVAVGSAGEAAHEVIRRLTAPGSNVRMPVVIDAVGHRIVHGGARFYEPTLVTESVQNDIRALIELAPLHNPSGVAGIEAAAEALPCAANIAIFDTAFHHNLPAVASHYALPAALSAQLDLRRYGFHGLSYRYVVDRVLHSMQRPVAGTRLIVCHLGNGASVCAIRDGASIDTSMGFTPLEGLIMGTRCGDIDAGLVVHLMRLGKASVDQLDETLNRKSGLLGLSGLSGDVRDLEKAAIGGNASAEFALDCFAYRVRKYVGAYAAALGGVDALIFTAGIGEHSASMRARICAGLDFLGLQLDDERNRAATGREPAAIGASSRPSVWIVPTDEERQIARETFALL
jgi:acetate kinase